MSTDFHLSPPPITHQPDALQVNVSNAVADHYCGRSERGQFKPWALLQTPEWGRAFRFVYPILLVSAMNRAYLYDVESANLVQTIQDTQMNIDGIPLGDINYVEINDSLVIICGTEELRAFHRSNGAVAFRIPPKLPASVPRVGVEVGSSFDAGHNNLTPLSFVSMQRRAAELTSKFVGGETYSSPFSYTLLH